MDENKTQKWIDENIAPIVKAGIDRHAAESDFKLPPLPEYRDICTSDGTEKSRMTRIERFVCDNEPAGEDDESWRAQLQSALQEAFDMGRAAVEADRQSRMRSPECLGWEQKVKTKRFGEAELKAHTKAGEFLGRHRAFHECADMLSRYGSSQPAASAEPASVSSPGQSDEAFNRWYEAEFKPGMERGPLDKYVARQAWFAALRAPVGAPVAQEPIATLHGDGYWTWKKPRHEHDPAFFKMDVYAAPVAAQPSVPESVICVLNKLWEAIQGMEHMPGWQDVARARADLGLAPAPKEDQS